MTEKSGMQPERKTDKKTGRSPLPKAGGSSFSFAAAFAVTLFGVLFLPQMLLSEGRGLGFSNSFLSVAVFLLAFPAVPVDFQHVSNLIIDSHAGGKSKL